jgi:branched-chain amino acid transport system substrate-binding protein
MTMRRLVGLVTALLFVVPVAAAPQTAEPFHIPVILPLAGTAAFIGKGELDDLRLIEKLVNKEGGIRGRPVVFDVKDDGSNTQTAIQLTNEILAARPPMVLGSSLTQDCNAMAPLFQEKGPVVWCFSPAIVPKPGGYIFSSSVSIRDCVLAQIRYFRERGLRRIAILSSTDATGQAFDGALRAAKELPENKDVTYVAYEHFNLTDVSVSAQVARMKAASPQAIFTWTVGPAFGTELHGLYDGGLGDVPHAASNGDMIFKQLSQYKRFLPKELLFSAVLASGHEDLGNPQIRARQSAYFDAFKEAGTKPDFPITLGWDPALLTIDMYRQLGFTPTAAQVKAWFDGLHGWIGINGPYDFRNGNRRGLGENDVIISRYDPAKEDFVTASKPGGHVR